MKIDFSVVSVLLFIAFMVLKITHYIDWSWVWITAPLWIPYLLWLSFLILAGFICFIANRE